MNAGKLRYLLVSTPIVVGFVASGLFALYRKRRFLGLLTLLWLAAGLTFAGNPVLDHLVEGRSWPWKYPPWHLISRWMQESDEKYTAMTFGVSHKTLQDYYAVPGNMHNYLFSRHDIDLRKSTVEDAAEYLSSRAGFYAGYWLVFQESAADAEAMMSAFGYELCARDYFPNSTVVATYWLKNIACRTEPLAVFSTDVGEYRYFSATYDNFNQRLLVAGLWHGSERGPGAPHNLSLQLLDDDWEKLAQLDLPLEQINELRQFSMKIADAPAGDYRLVAIVYNAETGERQAWHDNDGWIPEMQELATILIPKPASDSP